jgi:hypothetical protein
MAKITEERRGQYMQSALKIIHEKGGQRKNKWGQTYILESWCHP